MKELRALKKLNLLPIIFNVNVNVNAEITTSPEKLVLNHLNKNFDECLVVLGSIYLIGQIKLKLPD